MITQEELDQFINLAPSEWKLDYGPKNYVAFFTPPNVDNQRLPTPSTSYQHGNDKLAREFVAWSLEWMINLSPQLAFVTMFSVTIYNKSTKDFKQLVGDTLHEACFRAVLHNLSTI